MHARVQMVKALPPQFNTPEAAGYITDIIRAHPGFCSLRLMLQIGSHQGLNLTLWDSLENAMESSSRTQAAVGTRPFPLDFDEVYDVLAVVDGPTEASEAMVCQVSWFDGPRSAAQAAAMHRAGEERITPAIEHVPGLVTVYVLCRPADSAVAIFTFAESTAALDRIVDAVAATPLLPGEDPALLGGPDRIEIYTVENQAFAPVPVP